VLRNGDRLSFEGPPDIMTQLGRSGDVGLGISLEPSIVGGVSKEYPADEIGLRPFDRIVAIDGKPVRFWAEMTGMIQASEGTPFLVRWERPDSLVQGDGPATVVGNTPGHTVFEAEVTPRYDEDLDLYQLGIRSPTYDVLSNEFGIRHDRLTLPQAVVAGLRDTWINGSAIVTSLQRIFSGREDLRENLGGPIMVAKVTKEAAELGASYFWRIVAVLSITLAIMNILPIPALDGGHLVFLLYEGITRREPSLRVRMVMQQVGMILLLVFMTFLVFNDILRF
jgi:regulator of sigma E protease